MSNEKFGAFIRKEREGKEIGLREMAKMIRVSPTYLSKVEGVPAAFGGSFCARLAVG